MLSACRRVGLSFQHLGRGAPLMSAIRPRYPAHPFRLILISSSIFEIGMGSRLTKANTNLR